MATITNAALNLFLDDMTRLHMRMIGTQASGYGLGQNGQDWGAIQVLNDLINPDLLAANDLQPIVNIGTSVLNLEAAFTPFGQTASTLSSVFVALQTHLTAARLVGVSSVNSYLGYYNVGTGGTWLVQQHHAFKDLHDAWSPQACLDPWNSYFEVLQGVTDLYANQTFNNALGKFVVSGAGAGAFTAGYVVDATKYAGGTPQLNVSGLAGSGIVTVTGTAFDPMAKAATAGKTWTVNVNANGRVALVPGGGSPAPANSLICADSNVTIAAGITAGTIYVEGARPAGRALLP